MFRIKSIIESILFFNGEPISVRKIAKISGIDENSVKNALTELQKEFFKEKRGLAILCKDGEYQMITNPENAGFLKELVSFDIHEELTPAAVETLSIIAYRGPITRSEIDYIRGVNSSFIIRNLLIRGLVERKTNERDSRSYVYIISFDFMKILGISRLEDLPDFGELSKKEII